MELGNLSVILRRENNGRDEPNLGTLYTYMEMPQ
jgi:hypothetical protein